MPKIGPQSAGGEQTGSGQRAEVVAPGVYVIAMDRFTRKLGRSGADYLNAKWEICAGRNAGKRFFAILGLDFSKPGTVTRWQILLEAVGVEEEIELGSSAEGTAREGDRNIARLVRGRAFVAEIDKTVEGQYTNNGIKQVEFPRKWTADQRQAVEEWNERQQQRADPEDYAGEPPGPGYGDPEDPAADEDDFGPLDYEDEPAPPPRDAVERVQQRRRTERGKAKALDSEPPPPPAPADDDDAWRDNF
jgi:hypothetical protein